MGNICCQTDITASAIDGAIPLFNDYQHAELPANDPVFEEWLSSTNFAVPKPGNEQGALIMKNKNFNKYYIGAWKEEKPEGRSVIYEPNKILFVGTFRNGVPNGEARINLIQEQYEYEGQLVEGKANGQGTLDNIKSKFRFAGLWQDSRPKNGTLTLSADPNISSIKINDFSKGEATINYKDNRKYQGLINTVKLCPHGKGKVTFDFSSSKMSYEGDWFNGVMHGHGKFIWRDSTCYEGQFINGKKEGYGKFDFLNGNYYEGYWLGGKQNGTGTLYDKNKQVLKKGTWSNGLFVETLKEQDFMKENLRLSEVMDQNKSRVQTEFRREQEERQKKAYLSAQKSEIKVEQTLTKDEYIPGKKYATEVKRQQEVGSNRVKEGEKQLPINSQTKYHAFL